jgi:selenide,water dikinase
MGKKLTQLTEAGGCGCKIPPGVLDSILCYGKGAYSDAQLLVGNISKDDAAIYQIDKNRAVVSTVDFFTPIVDDPYTFGKIAAANAISDVYAMGGTPLWALAILGFPINDVKDIEVRRILEGAVSVCEQAGVVIAGGHTINNPQPIFGLCVNGFVEIDRIKENNKAKVGDLIFITKPLGVGILSTAIKVNKIQQEHYDLAVENMTTLNDIGRKLSKLNCVNAMTDITGFGLAGHLLEICTSSNVSAEVYFDKVPIIKGIEIYTQQNIVTGGGKRNWKSYKEKIVGTDEFSEIILSDPQTNGGILITVTKDGLSDFYNLMNENKLTQFQVPIGKIIENNNNQLFIL